MSDDLKEPNRKETGGPNRDKTPSKPPFALMVWLLIFAAIGFMLVGKYQKQGNVSELNQTEFFNLMDKELIASAEMSSDVSSSWDVRGEILDPVNNTRRPYTARIMSSGDLLNYFREYEKTHSEFKLLINKNDDFMSSLILSLLPVILIIGLLYFLFSRQMKSAGKGAMQFGKSKARMIPPEDLKITFSDIAGADEAKEETKEIIDFLKDPEKFQRVGGKIPKGCLLMGPPGTGKTLLAKAVASEANAPFFAISGSDFVEMFVGVGASRVRDMFEQARKHSPSIIFIDEIDAVGRSRFSGMGGGHDEREQTLNAMLVEMDGLETKGGVIVIAATNRPDVLDPALLRPGRFDRQIALDLPDIKGRRQIVDVHIKNIKVSEDVNLDLIARGTPGFSGADIANLINEAALHAARNDRECATAVDFEDARDKVNWGRERKSKRMPEKERINTSYHEVGHALVGLYTEKSTPLHKVTIIPRGRALGMTMSLPVEDSYSTTKQEYLDELAVLMGGRAAEAIKFGDVTSGASSDIDRATNIAQAMVCNFGMSDAIGIIKYGRDQQQDEMHPGGRAKYSNQTAREIDEEIKRILTEAYDRAAAIINDHIDQFELFAQELLEKETMDVVEVKTLLGMSLGEDNPISDFSNESKSVDVVEDSKESDDVVVEKIDSPEDATVEAQDDLFSSTSDEESKGDEK